MCVYIEEFFQCYAKPEECVTLIFSAAQGIALACTANAQYMLTIKSYIDVQRELPHQLMLVGWDALPPVVFDLKRCNHPFLAGRKESGRLFTV
ncbi:hypothetical protein D2E26_1036 [Bifidobacterium dolichotidis]|uniref:Uncharacterized protein n=1 Tax=Bifidobacterium dolichotidis TaxID=2306976 RepID=A0A430FQ56_9BIFI|nr:hypothetical protein D2E26_1036 [Bifidobacterium dolichotidis]